MLIDGGKGGWAYFSYSEVVVRVRFVARSDGRLEPAEMHVDGAAPLTGDVLRNIPLAGMEAWANGRGRNALLEGIESAGSEIEQATEEWRRKTGAGFIVVGPEPRRRALRLRIPDGLKRPDSFYQKVAEIYSALAENSHCPAAEIAEANGVPVTTVHRWIKEARARKLLGAGQRGKAG